MKRILSAVLCIALLLTCSVCAVPVSAAGEDVVIGATAKVTDPREGQGTLTVTLTAKANSGLNTMVLRLGYNSDTLRLASVTNGDVFSEANGGTLTITNTADNPACMYFEHPGVENITATGKIATVKFDIIDDMGDFNLSITVDEENTFASNGEAPVDVTVAVANEITRNNQHVLTGLPTTIQPTCTEPGRIEKKCPTCDRVISVVPNGEPLGHDWEEMERVEPTTTSEGYVESECFNCGEIKREILPKIEIKKVTLNGLYTVEGDKLTLTLKLSGNTGINTLTANLAYNADALALESVENGNVFCAENGGNMFAVNTERNPLILLFDENGAGNITANGTLATLVFTVKDASADKGLILTVDSKNTIAAGENNTPVDVPFNEPAVREQSANPGDINGDEKVNSIDAYLLKRIIVGALIPNDAEKAAADINNDGKVNSIDSNLIKRIIMGIK